MSRFDALMDDIQSTLILSVSKKKVFLPALLSGVIGIVLMVVLYLFLVIVGMVYFVQLIKQTNFSFESDFGLIIGGILIVFFTLICFLIYYLLSEIAVNSWVIASLNNTPLTFKLILQNIKSFFFSVFGTYLLLKFLLFFAFLILFIPIIIYVIFSSLLTGGWGFLLFVFAIQSLVGYWMLILMHDRCTGIESLKRNFSFGKKYLSVVLFILALQYFIQSNLPIYFTFIAVLLTPVVLTFIKILLLITYKRYTQIPPSN